MLNPSENIGVTKPTKSRKHVGWDLIANIRPGKCWLLGESALDYDRVEFNGYLPGEALFVLSIFIKLHNPQHHPQAKFE